MEIIPGVHKIDGVKGANCYLVTSGKEMVLIDAGMRGSSRKIADYVNGLGKNPSDIKYIVMTHSDIDHIGGAAETKQLTGAKLVIHAGDAPVLTGDNTGRLRNKSRFVKISMRILSKLVSFPSFTPDIVLKGNIDIAGYQIISTPGHSDGSISIYIPGKVIFVGDALRSDADGNLKRPSKMLAADMEQAKESVRVIAALDFDTLLVGHGAPVKDGAAAKVKKLLADWK
jgi:hydroxyacylglutathione hydrolase